MKYILMACAAAALAGCSTYDERDAQGRAASDNAVVEGPNRGVSTNYFGPVNSGAEAARGVGTPSGGGHPD